MWMPLCQKVFLAALRKPETFSTALHVQEQEIVSDSEKRWDARCWLSIRHIATIPFSVQLLKRGSLSQPTSPLAPTSLIFIPTSMPHPWEQLHILIFVCLPSW